MRLGVLGWPVRHSRSPAMHRAAFAACGLEGWSYQRLPVPPELFAETVRALGAAGFAGANVTVPHKRAALEIASEASEAAREIGAANTLSFGPDGSIRADNTDAPGLIDALPLDVAGRRALVLGAGGSGRAAVWALREAGAQVAVWNRTAERASRLAEELGVRAVAEAEPADVLVNCTTVGMDVRPREFVQAFRQLPVEVDEMGGYACVVDLVYGTERTALLAAALQHGAAVVDGLEVLVRQGARSFEIWTGRSAPVEAMRRGAANGD
jgi:shikimate dehydrogenase